MVSRAIRRIVLAQCERCKAEKRTIMVKKNNECKVTADGAARYDFPYFVPIEDGDTT